MESAKQAMTKVKGWTGTMSCQLDSNMNIVNMS